MLQNSEPPRAVNKVLKHLVIVICISVAVRLGSHTSFMTIYYDNMEHFIELLISTASNECYLLCTMYV